MPVGLSSAPKRDAPELRIANRAACYLLLAACTCSAGTTDAIAQAGDLLREFNARITGVDKAKEPMPDVGSFMRRVEAEFTDGITEYLNSTGAPAAADLTEKLQKARAAPVVVPQLAAVIVLPSKGAFGYAVALSLTYCPTCTWTWLAVFEPTGGRYACTVQLENPIPNHTVQLIRVASVDGRAQFLLWGVRLGDSHTRVTIEIWSLSGRVLVPVWERTDLPGGSVSVDGTELTLRYRRDLSRTAPELVQFYKITAAGPQLRGELETPP